MSNIASSGKLLFYVVDLTNILTNTEPMIIVNSDPAIRINLYSCISQRSKVMSRSKELKKEAEASAQVSGNDVPETGNSTQEGGTSGGGNQEKQEDQSRPQALNSGTRQSGDRKIEETDFTNLREPLLED